MTSSVSQGISPEEKVANAEANATQVVDGSAKKALETQAKESFKSRTVFPVADWNRSAIGGMPYFIVAYSLSCIGTSVLHVVKSVKDFFSTEPLENKQIKLLSGYEKEVNELVKLSKEKILKTSESSHTDALNASTYRIKSDTQAEKVADEVFAYASTLGISSLDEILTFLSTVINEKVEKVESQDESLINDLKVELEESLSKAFIKRVPGFVMDQQVKKLTYTDIGQIKSASIKMYGFVRHHGITPPQVVKDFEGNFKKDSRLLNAAVKRANDLAKKINAERTTDFKPFEEKSKVANDKGKLESAFTLIQKNAAGIDAVRAEVEELNSAYASVLGSLPVAEQDHITDDLRIRASAEKFSVGNKNISGRELVERRKRALDHIDRFDAAVRILENADFVGHLGAVAHKRAEDAAKLEEEFNKIIAFFTTVNDVTLEPTVPTKLSQIEVTPAKSGDMYEVEDEIRHFLLTKLEVAQKANCRVLVDIILRILPEEDELEMKILEAIENLPESDEKTTLNSRDLGSLNHSVNMADVFQENDTAAFKDCVNNLIKSVIEAEIASYNK